MKLDLQGQTAVVVGGANGIGRAIAQEFYREGCHVALVDLDPAVTKTAATFVEEWSDPQGAAPRCEAWVTDITNESSTRDTFAAIVEALGDFRHVVIAAGIGSGKFGFPFWNMSPQDWKKVMDVNVMGVVHVAHAQSRDIDPKGEWKHHVAGFGGRANRLSDRSPLQRS